MKYLLSIVAVLLALSVGSARACNQVSGFQSFGFVQGPIVVQPFSQQAFFQNGQVLFAQVNPSVNVEVERGRFNRNVNVNVAPGANVRVDRFGRVHIN